MGGKSGSGIRDEHPRSLFQELSNSLLLGLKILKFFNADPDPRSGIFYSSEKKKIERRIYRIHINKKGRIGSLFTKLISNGKI
jgi:hypothetical protein